MSIQNVALIGGTGTLGSHILAALKSSPFDISILSRESSKSTYPDTRVITIPNNYDILTLTQIFRSNKIDALVVAIAGSHVEDCKNILEAAFKGGVKRVIPPEFGSCDSADEKTNEILPLMKGKKVVRDFLISLQDQERGESMGKMSWTALVTGHFFDHGLPRGLLNIKVKERKAYIIDGGDIKFSASNLAFIADTVVHVLQHPQQSENKLLYVHSHNFTQNEVLAAVEKVTGERFERVQRNSEEELKVSRPKMLAGDMDAQEEVVAVWGMVASDWAKRYAFANELLELKEEDLEETVRRAIGKL